MAKRLFFFLLILFSLLNNVKSSDAFYPEAAFFTQTDENYFYHTIERGQTVFSIAKMYHVTVDDIYRLNPGSKEGIRTDDQLKIPQESGSYLYHTIEPNENLYSLSKRYHMTGDDIISVNPGLSVETFTIGRIIRIPTNLVTEPIQGGDEVLNQRITNSLLDKVEPFEKASKLRIALLLPFGTKEEASQENTNRNRRYVEYLEGFLLAVREMKQKGRVIDLKLYDTGPQTSELLELVQSNSLQDVDLLIGGVTDAQIRILSRYSKDYNIPYVIPTTSTSDVVLDNSKVFQINTPHSYVYSKASLAFLNRYQADHILLVKDPSALRRANFIQQLEDDLKRSNITYTTIEYDAEKFAENLQNLLDGARNNVIIPADDSYETLSKLLTSLKLQQNASPDVRISLFGHPLWQTFTADFTDDFFNLNTTFYSFFYANPTSLELKSFYNTFFNWYSHELIDISPKYGVLGYDTGKYFMELIDRYGKNFDSYVNDLNFNGVQTDFKFDRINNWSGFINTNLYLVEFMSDNTISRTIIR